MAYAYAASGSGVGVPHGHGKTTTFVAGLTAAASPRPKALLAAGMRQHEIAAKLGINQGRIGEIHTGKRFADVEPDINALV